KLKFASKSAAVPLLKLLNSAIANAEHNFQMKKDNLFIKEIRVDMGPALKRWKPRAFGRASGIRKETSHILIILGEVKPTAEKAKSKKDTPSVAAAKIVNSLDEVKGSVLDEDKDSDQKKHEGHDRSGSKGVGEKGKKRFFNRKSG
ncbi:MAG TPA: 50S ribosomal protein L22, partial [Patescibacteria group bacterium]|nr:50S ribosomal protein L22 [Patescibacteria group bacterium]